MRLLLGVQTAIHQLFVLLLRPKMYKQLCIMTVYYPSFIWRSILWGRQMLHKGLRWRVGNGSQISVFNSNWIKKHDFKRHDMHTEFSNDTVVADLIDENHQWKEAIICQHFSKEASERIVQTPLPRSPQQDILIWKFDKHGSYSVKSGYQLALKKKILDNPGCSDTSKTHWEVVWANEIPEKVKIFMWRAAKNLLPTASNLCKRKVIMDPTCKRCSSKSEDVFHALLECRVARKVWKETDFYEEVKQMPHQDMLSLLQEMASKRMKKDVELFIAVCWAIWYSRNCFIFEGKKEDPLISVARAAAVVESFKRIKIPKDQSISRHGKICQLAWTAPPNGCFKVNVDAAVKVSEKKAGLGVVIRNSSGRVVAIAVKNVPYQGNVACMEAEAVLFGMQTAQQVDFVPMIIESDSKEVVDLSLNRKESKTEIEWKIAEIRTKLRIQSQASINFAPRSCNVVAHSIAKIALDVKSLCIWLENFPVQVMCLLSKFV